MAKRKRKYKRRKKKDKFGLFDFIIIIVLIASFAAWVVTTQIRVANGIDSYFSGSTVVIINELAEPIWQYGLIAYVLSKGVKLARND